MDVAQQHIHTAVKNVIRDDYSTWHTFFFDVKTGEPDHGSTCQGYRDGSAWSRGQAWGIYGLALAYRYTKEAEYVDLFKKVTAYFMEHLPEDLIPYWDLEFAGWTEEELEKQLKETGYYESITSIKGIGVVSAAMLIGEIGDISRFESYEQIRRYAGLNLVENSSGKHQGRTTISKRGRGLLRSILYRIAFTMVGHNEEIKQLYKYLTTRKQNQLKKKQAIIAVEGKILQIIYAVITKNEEYEATRVFTQERIEQLKVA